MRSKYTFLWLFVLMSVTSMVVIAQTGTEIPTLERIKRATVFVIQSRSVGDRLVTTCVGSGTIVSRNGLVLTNAHNTLRSSDCPGDTLVIALSLDVDQPPVPIYRADIAQANAGLDLAVLQINRELNGRVLEAGTLALPFVEIGDSSRLSLDERLTVVGYPNIGNEGALAAEGTIISFIAEPGGADKSWIKSTAVIPATMTGGGAYDLEGRLIGIPTTAPISGQEITCKVIEDTNLDGLINNNDDCIPIGDFVNALRPVNFAAPLFKAAQLGLQVETITTPSIQTEPVDEPIFSRLFFSPAVTNELPTTVVSSLPVGTSALYLFFDYENMTSQNVYELRVTRDGIPEPTFSLAPVRWSGGERGIWYIGSSGQPWPNGVYEFRLFIDGISAATKRITIGGPPESAQVFSNIVFGVLDNQGNALGNGYVLPQGSLLSAKFIYQNMVEGTPWLIRWLYGGAEITRTQGTWDSSANGSQVTNLQPEQVFPGRYRLELYINDGLAATSDFIVAGLPEGPFPEIFIDSHFTSANSPEEAIRGTAVSAFPDLIDNLYVLFDWQEIEPGTLWTMRWSVDDEVFFEQTHPWNAPRNGQDYLTRLSAPGPIPDGTYKFELLINGVLLISEEAQVGIGQLPIDQFAQASGIQLRGTIIDAETGAGLEGVTFILITEDFSVEDFVWDQEQVYALATTDRNGRFEIDRPLEYDTPYSVVIAAEGYLPITADGFTIEEENGNLIDLTIPLTRD